MYLTGKGDAAPMILWSIQKFVTELVTQLLEKQIGIARLHIENTIVIFGARSHRLPILKNAIKNLS